MAFTRIALALAEGGRSTSSATATRRAASRTSRDVVDATIARDGAAARGTYNVGGGAEASMREAIAMLERDLGRGRSTCASTRRCRATSARTSADTSRASAPELGWEPTTALEDGLRAQWEWASAARVAARDEPGAPLAPTPTPSGRSTPALWARLADRWWLPVAGLVVGAVVGVLVSVGGGQTWKAKTLLYLGQPFTTSGGGQIQSLATNPRTVSEIIRSEFALRRASAESGLRVGQLRGHVTSQARDQRRADAEPTPLVEISVNGPGAAQGRQGGGCPRASR